MSGQERGPGGCGERVFGICTWIRPGHLFFSLTNQPLQTLNFSGGIRREDIDFHPCLWHR